MKPSYEEAKRAWLKMTELGMRMQDSRNTRLQELQIAKEYQDAANTLHMYFTDMTIEESIN